MTITQVAGHGAQRGITQQWKGNTYTVDLLTKAKLEMVIADCMLEPVLTAINESASTGEIGDGKVFVSTIDDVCASVPASAAPAQSKARLRRAATTALLYD